MNPDLLGTYVIAPTFALLGPRYAGPSAEVMLHAIALQESALEHRRQVRGPARGWWQFEQGGGVAGVLSHPASRDKAREVCAVLGYTPAAAAVHAAIEHNDLLACAFARLLLYTDPRPLPRDAEDGWDYYLRNWRPGKPHPSRWGACWNRAQGAVYGD